MTKRGVGNTWRRGDLNRLDPLRLERFRSEHEFVTRLVSFRLSPAGAPLRPRDPVTPTWMEVVHQDGGDAFAAVINADGSLGPSRILLACNPHTHEAVLEIPRREEWVPVVLSPVPSCPHAPDSAPSLEGGRLVLPPLGCGVWVARA